MKSRPFRVRVSANASTTFMIAVTSSCSTIFCTSERYCVQNSVILSSDRRPSLPPAFLTTSECLRGSQPHRTDPAAREPPTHPDSKDLDKPSPDQTRYPARRRTRVCGKHPNRNQCNAYVACGGVCRKQRFGPRRTR